MKEPLKLKVADSDVIDGEVTDGDVTGHRCRLHPPDGFEQYYP